MNILLQLLMNISQITNCLCYMTLIFIKTKDITWRAVQKSINNQKYVIARRKLTPALQLKVMWVYSTAGT